MTLINNINQINYRLTSNIKISKGDLEFMFTDDPIFNTPNININIRTYVRGERKIIFMINHIVSLPYSIHLP